MKANYEYAADLLSRVREVMHESEYLVYTITDEAPGFEFGVGSSLASAITQTVVVTEDGKVEVTSSEGDYACSDWDAFVALVLTNWQGDV